MSDATPGTEPPEQEALLAAAQALLTPLAQLLVARGVHFSTVEERLKTAFIAAARDAALQTTPGALPHRLVSRISTTTGINRREVTRLVQADLKEAAPRRSPAVQAFVRWSTDPDYLSPEGSPLPLPRSGESRSFEQLAASITRDVHPRSLLDDLVRLKLVVLDEAGDMVRLDEQAFAPREDVVRMLGYLGANVGAHLKTAVQNVIDPTQTQLEQAIHAHGLSEDSLSQLRTLVAAQWSVLLRAMVPELQRLVNRDVTPEGEPALPGTVRIGMYVHADGGLRSPVAPRLRKKDSKDDDAQ